MKLIFSILLICQLQTICAQQKSEIKIDSGSGNDVEILQTAPNDSSQFTTLTLDKSDSNKLKVIQINDNSQNEKTNQRAWNWINNTNTIVSLIGGLILICTTLFLKSRKKER